MSLFPVMQGNENKTIITRQRGTDQGRKKYFFRYLAAVCAAFSLLLRQPHTSSLTNELKMLESPQGDAHNRLYATILVKDTSRCFYSCQHF